jgi:hypothetical protein
MYLGRQLCEDGRTAVSARDYSRAIRLRQGYGATRCCAQLGA